MKRACSTVSTRRSRVQTTHHQQKLPGSWHHQQRDSPTQTSWLRLETQSTAGSEYAACRARASAPRSRGTGPSRLGTRDLTHTWVGPSSLVSSSLGYPERRHKESCLALVAAAELLEFAGGSQVCRVTAVQYGSLRRNPEGGLVLF